MYWKFFLKIFYCCSCTMMRSSPSLFADVIAFLFFYHWSMPLYCVSFQIEEKHEFKKMKRRDEQKEEPFRIVRVIHLISNSIFNFISQMFILFDHWPRLPSVVSFVFLFWVFHSLCINSNLNVFSIVSHLSVSKIINFTLFIYQFQLHYLCICTHIRWNEQSSRFLFHYQIKIDFGKIQQGNFLFFILVFLSLMLMLLLFLLLIADVVV